MIDFETTHYFSYFWFWNPRLRALTDDTFDFICYDINNSLVKSEKLYLNGDVVEDNIYTIVGPM